MKKLNLILSIFLFTNTIFSQNDFVEGIVLNEKKEALDYVSIGIVGTSLGTVSGIDGDFKLYFTTGVNGTDTVRFSSIGFESQDIIVDQLRSKKTWTIKMKPANIMLEEVVVTPDFVKTITKGCTRTKARMNVFYSIASKPNQNLGAEIGRKFPIKKITQLKKFRFYITNNNFDTVRFRINVYHFKNRKPGKNILSQNIIKEVTEKKSGWIEVDLDEYHILTDQSVVVGVEWIFHSEKGKSLTLPIAMPANGPHFYKFGSQSKWKRFGMMSSAMELDLAY